MSQPLSYDVLGSGPGLVLLHGIGASGLTNWHPVTDQLAAEYTLVLPNLPGSGRSPLPGGPLDADAVADHVVATAVEAGLQRFALAGISLGAAVAVKAAARYPDLVSRLVTVAGYATPRPALRLSLELWAAMHARQDTDAGKLLAMLSFSDEHLAELPGEYLPHIVQFVTANIAPGTAAQLDLALRIDVRTDMAKVQAPALILAPAADRFVDPAHSRELAAAIPGARLLGVAGGHLAIFEDYREILTALQEFLTS